MQLLGYMRAYFHLPYRQTQGVVIAHASKEVPCIPDYSTISRRINRLEIKINQKLGNEIVIALDSTGIKVLMLSILPSVSGLSISIYQRFT
jgi:Transposase DDE domain